MVATAGPPGQSCPSSPPTTEKARCDAGATNTSANTATAATTAPLNPANIRTRRGGLFVPSDPVAPLSIISHPAYDRSSHRRLDACCVMLVVWPTRTARSRRQPRSAGGSSTSTAAPCSTRKHPARSALASRRSSTTSGSRAETCRLSGPALSSPAPTRPWRRPRWHAAKPRSRSGASRRRTRRRE